MSRSGQLQKTDGTLRKELIISKEKTYVYDTYVKIVEEIIVAYQSEMPFIPFSEWISELDKYMFVEDHSEEMEKLVRSLKDNLKRLAVTLHYTYEDNKGFLLLQSELKSEYRETYAQTLRKMNTGDMAQFIADFLEDLSGMKIGYKAVREKLEQPIK